MWFEKLTGFKEESPEQVRKLLQVKDKVLISSVNGKTYCFGKLDVLTLNELRMSAPLLSEFQDKIIISEVVGNVQDFHVYKENEGALFQAASQFNLLEMISPHIMPENGVDRYENDYTQGPACAIACGAGTIYRNYFAKVNGQIGQSANNQIDCLRDIGIELGNDELKLWQMQNGYALATKEGLINISQQIEAKGDEAYEHLKGKLRIGIQWDTEVTLNEHQQCVSQAYCSALPVSYSSIDAHYWEDFARLILEASYEATLYAALINYAKTNNTKVYLTLVGGGAFGNDVSWITDAIKKAIIKFANTPLDVKLISYGKSDAAVRHLINSIEHL